MAGWTSLAFIVVLLGAVQMFVLGMIGEYLGRLYVESKRRPLYLVSDVAGPVQGKASLGYRAEDKSPSLPRPESAKGASPTFTTAEQGQTLPLPLPHAEREL